MELKLSEIESITGSSRGVIPIAIATAKVKDNIKSCFQILIKNTRGIIISMNFINSLLILLTPFWKAVSGFPVIVCAIFER